MVTDQIYIFVQCTQFTEQMALPLSQRVLLHNLLALAGQVYETGMLFAEC